MPYKNIEDRRAHLRLRIGESEWAKNRRRGSGRGQYMHHAIKNRCKKLGVGYSLTADWFQKRFDAGVCELSGVAFDMEGKRTRNAPTVDRINPIGAYSPDNCRMVLWSINKALCNYGEDYIFGVFEKILKKRGTV